MAHRQSIKHKLGMRRTITSSAFVLALLIGVTGLFSLFSIWSINRAWVDGMSRSGEMHRLAILSLSAEVAFKVQVQEWKNVLLRGGDPEMLANYRTAFRQRGTEAEQHLAVVAAEAERLGFPGHAAQAAELARAHQALAQGYEDALAGAMGAAAALTAEDARAVDGAVRGADRALEGKLHALSRDIAHSAEATEAELAAAMDERYRTLKWFIIGVIVATLAGTAAVLFGLLRATRD